MAHLTIEENYGKWKSPFTPEEVAKKTVNFGDLHLDSGKLFWSESRPWEQGRSFIVAWDIKKNGVVQDQTSNIYHVATNVHGYGGGAFLVQDNIIYFADALTNQVYKKDILQNLIIQITNGEGYSYADFSVDKKHQFLYCLRQAKKVGFKFPLTEIIRIHIQTQTQEVLFSGSDFYSNIRVHADGTKLLFLQWNYPNMPWDENELWTADVDNELKIKNLKKTFHKSRVSLYQPEWGEDHQIRFACDLNNYWNISEIYKDKFKVLFQRPADFARPLWVAGSRTFSFISQYEIVASCCENGVWKTFLIDIKNNSQTVIKNHLTCFYNMAASKDGIAYIGGHEKLALSVVFSPIKEKENIHILKSSLPVDLSHLNNFISVPKQIEFQSNNKKVFAFYYEPKNSNYKAKENELPPCIVKIHGGPTSSADFMFNPKIQFYTSRGYAYVEINYSGSAGYGREYRDRLNKMWGIVDVEDCIACAEYLFTHSLADKNKLILTGGSSGGFTLLNVLTKSNIFKCAACHYGIADLIDLANHIHKFEACYDQNLIGDTLQNNLSLYKERSPINRVQQIKCPVIFFHGDKDPVVHMNQTIKMVEALKKQNTYCEMTIFEGEGHGFKKEETIISVLEKELNFFEKII